jgi:dTDP-glucose 4,6-dehydratase
MALEGKKILITGGAGFIGSSVIKHLVKDLGVSVVNVDKLSYASNLESLIEVSSSPLYVFEKINICDKQKLELLFKQHKPDAVMHLAAESHVDRSIDSAEEFIQSNIVGTYTMLEVSKLKWHS